MFGDDMYIECPCCGSCNCYDEHRPNDYEYVIICEDCKEITCFDYIDMYGVMSVPYGFLY